MDWGLRVLLSICKSRHPWGPERASTRLPAKLIVEYILVKLSSDRLSRSRVMSGSSVFRRGAEVNL